MAEQSQSTTVSSPMGFQAVFTSQSQVQNSEINSLMSNLLAPLIQANIQSIVQQTVKDSINSALAGIQAQASLVDTPIQNTPSINNMQACTINVPVENNTSNTSGLSAGRHYSRLLPSSQFEDVSDEESERISFLNKNDNMSEVLSRNENDEISSQVSEKTTASDQGTSVCEQDPNNNIGWFLFIRKVANRLEIDCIDDPKTDKPNHKSYVPESVSKTTQSRSLKVRLPLDGVILDSLHSLDKEFKSHGSVSAFRARDDERFQIKSEHYENYCSVPKLDPNVEEGLTNCNQVPTQQKKKFKKSGFKFKNKTLFEHNNEMKRVDVQARLLLRANSYGTLITSYLSRLVNDNEEVMEGLQALFQVFSAMTDLSSRLVINAVSSRRNLHLQEMGFKNPSTEQKLRTISTLGSNIFGGKYFELLHDSAENIRDAKETQHLRKSYKSLEVNDSRNGTKRKVSYDHDQFESKYATPSNPKKPKYDNSMNKGKARFAQGKSALNRFNKSNEQTAKKGQLGFRSPK